MLVVQRAVSRSLVFCMVRTTAATSWGEPISARRDASFFDSWFTIMAALVTTTWGEVGGREDLSRWARLVAAVRRKGQETPPQSSDRPGSDSSH